MLRQSALAQLLNCLAEELLRRHVHAAPYGLELLQFGLGQRRLRFVLLYDAVANQVEVPVSRHLLSAKALIQVMFVQGCALLPFRCVWLTMVGWPWVRREGVLEKTACEEFLVLVGNLL